MRTIAIANQKGGCGKTTSSVNIAAAFAYHGKRTLIMDLDPQGHSTLGLGHNPETLDNRAISCFQEPSLNLST
jgi:chromosome partitioning protein